MKMKNKDPFRCIVPPREDGVYLGIAYHLKDVATAARIFEGTEEGYAYARCGEGNPTVRAFERAMVLAETGMEDGYKDLYFDALATSSGMAAITLLCLGLATKGKNEIVSSPFIYGGTYSLFTQYLPKLGITCKMVQDPDNIDSWEKIISPKTAFAFLESASNPLVEIPNLISIAELVQSYNVPLVCDNTVLTPALHNPLYYGVDIVVHSVSKAINGHSTGLGGVIIADEDLIRELRGSWASVIGATMDPDCAKRMSDGLKTLPERILRHSKNALNIAKFLSKRPEVIRAYYPLLPDDSNSYRNAIDADLEYGGPLLAFELKGGIENAVKFIESLKVVIHATHLGHNKTIATHPASTTHSKVPPEARKKLRISDTLIRISAGCEKEKEFEKVLKDIEVALETSSKV